MSTSRPDPRRLRNLHGARLLLLAVALTALPAAAAVTEHWYLFRARSNMEIRNYAAAIEAYRKVLLDEPTHREALRGLGIACEANGQTDQAIAAYDRYLARYPDDPEIALRQAHFLGWSRYAYRHADAVKYYRIALKHRDDPDERAKLARLLAQDRKTLPEALAEYRILLRQRPGDAALRAEYQKLVLWDPAHLDEAIELYSALARERPADRKVGLQYARLLSRHPRKVSEAAEQYRKLLEAQPSNRELRREYARVLARDSRRRREAREQLKRAGAVSYEDRLLHADLLAAEEAHRDEALDEYRVLVKQAPKNTRVRLKYARLLGGKLETNDEAIREYEAVLEGEPESGEAHRGLAHAWAWKGDGDRAVHHERLAKQHGGADASLEALGRDLGWGREPRAGGGLSVVVQPGSQFGLYGLRVPLHGQTDVTPFVTTRAGAGLETYWGVGAPAAGVFLDLGSEFRISRDQQLELDLGFRAVRPGLEALSGRVAFEHTGEVLKVRPQFERRAREDSFRAMIGTPSAGAVSSNLFGVRILRDGETGRAWVTPQVGFAAGGTTRANLMALVDATAELQLYEAAPIQVWAGVDSRLAHHGHDASSSALGGYFSPALHAVGVPRLTFRHVMERRHFFEAAAGPSLQYQLDHGGAGQFVLGAQAQLNGGFRLNEQVEAGVGAAFTRVGDAYLRVDCGGSLSYLF